MIMFMYMWLGWWSKIEKVLHFGFTSMFLIVHFFTSLLNWDSLVIVLSDTGRLLNIVAPLKKNPPRLIVRLDSMCFPAFLEPQLPYCHLSNPGIWEWTYHESRLADLLLEFCVQLTMLCRLWAGVQIADWLLWWAGSLGYELATLSSFASIGFVTLAASDYLLL